MLLLKANPELQKVFGKLIKTMKVPVTWNNVFVISNNTLILAGDVRSLIFNFDNRKSYTNIIEIPEEGARLQSMPADYILTNIMNMALYAFGKWGVINGLKVEQDYTALNALFADALRPVGIEPGFTKENFHFFKGGLQVTYEDAALAILRMLKQEGKLKEGQSLVTSDVRNKNEAPEHGKNDAKAEEPDEPDDDYYMLGLWHNMCWKTEAADFRKTGFENADASRTRIGNNFYLSNYLCPKCGSRLYLGIYPPGKEMLIETDEGRVFMARTYACDACNLFYTPCPKKLIQEGEVLELDYGNLPLSENLDPTYFEFSKSFDPENKYSLPYFFGTVGILYNKDIVDESKVNSWEILWDKTYSGQIIMADSVRDSFMVALKILGCSLNTTDETELKEAQDLLIQQKPLVYSYLVDEAQDEMISENAAMAVVYSGEAGYALEFNDKLAFSVPEEGSNMWIDSWFIPKSAKHKENAEKFLNFLCREDISMMNFDYVYYATPNKKTKDSLDLELQENTTIFPPTETLENCEVLKPLDDEATMKLNLLWKEIKSAD